MAESTKGAETMGIWGSGPFENDDAADFADDLDDADPAGREVLIRDALQRAVDADDVLPADDAARAVAAAAVVAASRTPGMPMDDDEDGPEFLQTGDLPPLPDDLVELAREALDRVTADESEWGELWDEAETLDEAVAALDEVRTGLV
jgi:hypothetical protein